MIIMVCGVMLGSILDLVVIVMVKKKKMVMR